MPKRILIACGGTGGHLFPGIAVAEELQKRGCATLLLVSKKSIDHIALAGRDDLKSAALSTIGFPGFFNIRILRFLQELKRGRQECHRLFREFQPDGVLGMGGFISAIPLWIGRNERLPLLLHESNAIPGKVTRVMSKLADRVLLGFGKCANYLSNSTCVVTGTPVRKGLKVFQADEARLRLGLDPLRKTILVMGGSQGAHGINELMTAALPFCKRSAETWQFVHLTGETDLEQVRRAYQALNFRALVEPFSSQMELLYSAADVAISRSGAASLTEISHYALPSLLIPFPEAADNHQVANARIFEEAGASLLREQNQVQPQSLAEEIKAWVEDDGRLVVMSDAAHSLDVENAAAWVANEVEACVTK